MSLEGHDRRLSRLEERDKKYDDKFETLNKKIDENEKKAQEDYKRLFSSMEEIKNGMHSQELINQKMNFTLDSINKERAADIEAKREREEKDEKIKDEQRKNTRKVVWSFFGLAGTIITSLIISALRLWIGI
ncbi:DUF2951 family protein [Salinicoccus sp. HZC-1]|uniref:DUF2951 family protein n=1 Tax=Salinicoccus sp. HZC-1 TaxID=3385497 RepID=UPI00398AEA39